MSDFLPSDVGPIINPLDLPPEEADAIFGKPLMDELRKKNQWTPGVYKIVSIKPTGKYLLEHQG